MARKERTERTVEDLIVEMEPVSPGKPPAQRPVRLPVLQRLLVVGLVLVGFGAGWMAAGLRSSLAEKQAAGGRGETRQDLLAAGWVEADQGVFTRRCQGICRQPRLYGGGLIDVMEVACLERPCGQIEAKFDVLDGMGQVLGEVAIGRPGRQGERLQLLIESDKPQARSFALRSFTARARVE